MAAPQLHPAPPTDGEETSGATEMTRDAKQTKRLDAGGSLAAGGRLGAARDWAAAETDPEEGLVQLRLAQRPASARTLTLQSFRLIRRTASCANDFVVFGTGTAGAATGASASATGTFSGVPTNGQTATLTYGSGAVDTVTATAAAKASTTGTFSGAPTTNQTVVVHGASNATFTAEDNTAATGNFTVAGSFCVAPDKA